MSDAKLILSTLIMGMKTLLYSITNYGNTIVSSQPGTPQLVGLTSSNSVLTLQYTSFCNHRIGK